MQVFIANGSRHVQVLWIRVAELVLAICKRKTPHGRVQQAHTAILGLQIEFYELSHGVMRPSQRHRVCKCEQITHVIWESIGGHRSQCLVEFILTVGMVVTTTDVDAMLPEVFA